MKDKGRTAGPRTAAVVRSVVELRTEEVCIVEEERCLPGGLAGTVELRGQSTVFEAASIVELAEGQPTFFVVRGHSAWQKILFQEQLNCCPAILALEFLVFHRFQDSPGFFYLQPLAWH